MPYLASPPLLRQFGFAIRLVTSAPYVTAFAEMLFHQVAFAIFL
jgi:hypothetical protein